MFTRKYSSATDLYNILRCCTLYKITNKKYPFRDMQTVRHIVGGELPSLQDIYTRRCIRKAQRIINDSSHPSHRLLSLLPSGRRRRSIRSRTSRLRDSFFPQAIRLMNRKNVYTLQHTPTLQYAMQFNFNTVQLDYTNTLHFNTVQLDYTHTLAL